jgi:transcriptional regulator with XRE-family HTH domain
MEPLSDVFGRRLKAFRKARGLTQEQLGRAAKVDYKHVGSIERGIHPPSFAAVERIAKALKVDYHELFLPDRLTTLEQQVQCLVPDTQKLDAEGVQQFFNDLSTAVRKLQLRQRG